MGIFNRKDAYKCAVLGLPGCGKSTFLVTLAQHAEIMKMGRASSDPISVLPELVSQIQNSLPTSENSIDHIEVCYEKCPTERELNKTEKNLKKPIIIQSKNIAGDAFQKRSDVFQKAIEGVTHVILLIDLSTQAIETMDKELSANSKTGDVLIDKLLYDFKYIGTNLLTIEKLKNLFIVFPKRKFIDPRIDTISREGINKIGKIFDRSYRVVLGNLEHKNVKIRGPYVFDTKDVFHKVTQDEDLFNDDVVVFTKLLYDLLN